jgi:glycosyltransferase involved in cell wall biosynthesis
MQARIRSHGAGARLIPFGIDVDRYAGPVARPDAKPFQLLHVGTLCAVKGQLSLLRATRLLLDRGVDVELHVVGWDDWDGTIQREALRLELGRRVTFHGWKTREELRRLHLAAHVFVMASIDDVAPVAVLEAAAAGLPIVGTDVGFIADWAPDMAVKTPVGDAVALARALETVLSDRPLREELAGRAQSWVRQHADLNADDAFMALYRELLTSGRARGAARVFRRRTR